MDFANADRLTSVVSDVLEAGHPDVVLDLAELDFMDSGGLGAMVAAWKATRAVGASLQVACDRRPLLQMLRITGLIKVFAVQPTLAACLSAARAAGSASRAAALGQPALRMQEVG
jgi:anti-sigma B factor antagonist